MQRMRPHVSPEPIQPHLRRRRSRPRGLKDPTCHPQRCISSHHLHTSHPLCHLASFRGRDVPLLAVVKVDVADLGACDVGEGFRGAEVGEEGAVALEDIGLFRAGGDGGRGVGPGAGVLGGVSGCEVKGAEGDADL